MGDTTGEQWRTSESEPRTTPRHPLSPTDQPFVLCVTFSAAFFKMQNRVPVNNKRRFSGRPRRGCFVTTTPACMQKREMKEHEEEKATSAVW
jgi:hypothetical protein